jgi:translation initiation factor IF-2
VVAFNIPVTKPARKLAQAEGVKIKEYKVIYELLEDVEKIILKLLEPTIDEEELGKAEILEIFEIKDNRIAGCKMRSGEIKKTDLVHLVRGGNILMDVKLKSLKQGKEDVDKVRAKTEFGTAISPSSKFDVGDFLVSYKKIEE